MKAQGCLPPVLVGGGAVEIYSNSAIITGDFDVSTARQDLFEEALREDDPVAGERRQAAVASGTWDARAAWVGDLIEKVLSAKSK